MKKQLHIILPFIVAGFLLFYAYGCEPKTASLIDPGKKVTRLQLVGEFDIFESQFMGRIDDLDQKQKIRDIVFQQGLIAVNTGGVNPVGVIMAVMSALGVAAIGDDVRLRRKIKSNSD